MSKASKPPVILYSALADATRCRIIEILRAGPVPVHRLAEAFAISRPAISRHLRVLKTAGLVAEVRKGRENLYAFKPQPLARALDWLGGMTAAAPARKPRSSQPPAPARPPRKVEPASQMGFDF